MCATVSLSSYQYVNFTWTSTSLICNIIWYFSARVFVYNKYKLKSLIGVNNLKLSKRWRQNEKMSGAQLQQLIVVFHKIESLANSNDRGACIK